MYLKHDVKWCKDILSDEKPMLHKSLRSRFVYWYTICRLVIITITCHIQKAHNFSLTIFSYSSHIVCAPVTLLSNYETTLTHQAFFLYSATSLWSDCRTNQKPKQILSCFSLQYSPNCHRMHIRAHQNPPSTRCFQKITLNIHLGHTQCNAFSRPSVWQTSFNILLVHTLCSLSTLMLTQCTPKYQQWTHNYSSSKHLKWNK